VSLKEELAMLEIIQAEMDEHAESVRELFGEYLGWVMGMLNREFGIHFDIAAVLEQDILTLGKFAPPSGRLLLARYSDRIVGLVCLKLLSVDTGELKRMYVRPQFRGLGIGHALVAELLAQARAIGYRRICLDSPPFSHAAHTLYRSLGFEEITAYPGVEIPKELHHNWRFMEKLLE
jgi:GNAT superfamily N-acetyltransferase